MIRIYRIYKEKDAGYESWYGTEQDIIKFLEEDVESHKDYNNNNHWEFNLELFGFVAEVVYAFEREDLLYKLIIDLYNNNIMTRLEKQTFNDILDILLKRKDLKW